jgi:hypothetical protein
VGPNQLDETNFVHHKGREIKNPKTSLMACLSAVVVGAMQGHRMALYRQQKQKEQEQRYADQRRRLAETVQCAEFLVAKLEQHVAGHRISASSQKEAIGFLQFHLSQLPATLQRIRYATQGLTEQATKGL